MNKNQQFLIVGLGLMGGSYACALSEQGFAVTAIDVDKTTIEWAKEKKIIAQGAVIKDGKDCNALIENADYIVLALYPDGILEWLKKNREFIKKGAIITDLAGVKMCFLDKAQELLTENEFIACHPMAGREVSGVQNATSGMFKNANFIITPTEKNTAEGVAFAYALAKQLGFGNITELTPQEHDKMVGYVSQLTHVIAVCLMNANDDPLLPKVTGDSFRDLTRIANMNDILWSELFLANKQALTTEIDIFIDTLLDLRSKLEKENSEELRALLQKSTARRKLFDKK